MIAYALNSKVMFTEAWILASSSCDAWLLAAGEVATFDWPGA